MILYLSTYKYPHSFLKMEERIIPTIIANIPIRISSPHQSGTIVHQKTQKPTAHPDEHPIDIVCE